jgi:transposase
MRGEPGTAGQRANALPMQELARRGLAARMLLVHCGRLRCWGPGARSRWEEVPITFHCLAVGSASSVCPAQGQPPARRVRTQPAGFVHGSRCARTRAARGSSTRCAAACSSDRRDRRARAASVGDRRRHVLNYAGAAPGRRLVRRRGVAHHGRWGSGHHRDRNQADPAPVALENPVLHRASDEHEELKRLRRENVRLKQERDLLKRAAAFFARETETR